MLDGGEARSIVTCWQEVRRLSFQMTIGSSGGNSENRVNRVSCNAEGMAVVYSILWMIEFYRSGIVTFPFCFSLENMVD